MPHLRCKGFTYLVTLFAVAIAGAMLGAGSVVWHQEAQRDREHELLRIGAEFRRAIGLYYERSPGAVKRYPAKLDDLLLDRRYLSMQRYLRRIYRDPITGKHEWGIVAGPDGGIMGVYSLSEQRPAKVDGFDEVDRNFAGTGWYSAWRFVYKPPSFPAPSAAQRAGKH